MRAVSYYAHLAPLLGPGKVLAVHRRTCTLETDAGALLTLALPDLGNGPGAILVAQGPWRVGERFFPEGGTRLRFAGGSVVDWREAPAWAPAQAAPSGPPIQDHAHALSAALAEAGPVGGLAPMVLGNGVAQDLLEATAAPLIAALPDSEAALGLIGLGPGSTPSGDDLVAGLLLTLHYARHPAAEPLRAVALQARTTRLGKAMLAWAARGEASEHTLLLLRSLFACPAPEALHPLGAVLAHGATSGADLAAGILVGLQFLRRR